MRSNFDEVLKVLEHQYHLNADEIGTEYDPRPTWRIRGEFRPAPVQASIWYEEDDIDSGEFRYVCRDLSEIYAVDAVTLPVLSDISGKARAYIEFIKNGGTWTKLFREVQERVPRTPVQPRVIPELSHLPKIRG